MGNLFAKDTKRISESDRAVLTLKTQRRKLLTEQKRIESLIEREVEIARQLIAQKQQDRALLVLRKKKLQQGRLKDLDNWLVGVEKMLGDIEATKGTSQLYAALKQGHIALKGLQQEVTIQDVEKLMDDNAAAKDYQDELSASLNTDSSVVEQDDVLAELSALEVQEDELPEVPRHELPKVVRPAAEVQVQTAEQKPQRLEEPIAA
ncbi:hypothetical protein ABBQ32_007835 [Trebouxia sp. C0010 RCD-2024]